MISKRILPFIVMMLIGVDTIAQIPPQTVVFKVRKVQKAQKIYIEEIKQEEPVFQIVEEPASFQGGDINTFRIWVQSNISYPDSAVKAGISGKVLVQFAVNSKGKVVDTKILRGVHPILDKEALKAVFSSPAWSPGKQGGRAVKQQFVIPILFQMP